MTSAKLINCKWLCVAMCMVLPPDSVTSKRNYFEKMLHSFAKSGTGFLKKTTIVKLAPAKHFE